jgi:GTP-binding protein
MPPALRNVAIIAHVDHGKTTLVDALLRQSGAFRENQEVAVCVMDSNDLERERGITILAKNTSVTWRDVRINLIDTPGHADFGGEVERVLRMADGVLLLVDAAEGPKPQTRFVLKKALGYRLKPIVVINKMDKSDARPQEVLNEIFDLFIELDAHDAQLDFPILYTIGRDGRSKRRIEDGWSDLAPLFDTILEAVHPPAGDPDAPLQILVSNIDYNDYVGRMAIGRISGGTVRQDLPVTLLKRIGDRQEGKIVDLRVFINLKRDRIEAAGAGDIVCIAGLPEVDIGDTIAGGPDPRPLPPLEVDAPTLSMIFFANDSPFSGEEGSFVTSRHLRDRLAKERRSNVALRVEDTDAPNAFKVSGRGLLHLSILIETMRREGFELQVMKPQVILQESGGRTLEPVEIATVDVPEAYAGRVIELFGGRKGTVAKMDVKRGRAQFLFRIPSRGLIGLASRLMNTTRGEAVMYHAYDAYEPHKGPIPHRLTGALVSMASGPATSYALDDLQDRGTFFIAPGDRVYEGMVVGENPKDLDIVVNVCRKKHLTNIRASTAEATTVLATPKRFSLEEALEYMAEDELVEVTPKNIRLRKRILDQRMRRRAEKAIEEAAGS